MGIAAALMLLSVAGCKDENTYDPEKDDSLKKVLDAGQLVLGLDLDFPPMGYMNDEGEVVGFDIDVAREVCRRLNIELVTQGIDWDEKEDDLNSGRIDCIWNGFSITPARDESMNLSDPYMKNEMIVVVSGESSLKALRDLKGCRVGVQSGSTAQEILEKSEIYAEVTPVLYDTVVLALKELDEGKIDAAVVDSIVAYNYILSSPAKYFVLSDSLGEEEYAVGFRKEDRKLRDRIQEIINEMKTDGTLGEISKEWFGSDITTVK